MSRNFGQTAGFAIDRVRNDAVGNAAGREQVSHVWVNGKLVLDDRQLTTIDTQEVIATAAYWRARIGAQ